MGHVFSLSKLDDYDDDDFGLALKEATRAQQLREAAPLVIAAIHGLPAAMDAELSQLDVYIGRAGASVTHLRNRWLARRAAFQGAPSTRAVVAVRAKTRRIREENWERTAQRVVNSLTAHGALCCSNALTGDSGRWPDLEDSVIYLVARLRRGKIGVGVRESALRSAVGDLLDNDDLEADVVREVSRHILHPDRATTHESIHPSLGDDEEDDEMQGERPSCKSEGCEMHAKPGNYGFCGMHRPYVTQGSAACRTCGRTAKPGNYGFCGYHR